jgi:REP element-mobilizing transposase RayT
MMPRPLRIEYEYALYHVLNRSHAGSLIFSEPKDYQSFLDILGEASSRFNCLIHAYCLLGNQYQLLIETPKANLSRAMRQINGVYTQHYNAVMATDGPLFKGRFKAVLIDKYDYLLKLSRYIHRRPIDIKKPVVSRLQEHQWSSYPDYIGQVKPAQWLTHDSILKALAQENGHQAYADYVMAGVDDEIALLYSRSRLPRVIGDKRFKQWIDEKALNPALNKPVTQSALTIEQVIDGVADFYGVSTADITGIVRGPQKENEIRKVAMYLCQELIDAKQTDIAKVFNLTHKRSPSCTTHQVRARVKTDSEFREKIEIMVDKLKRLT